MSDKPYSIKLTGFKTKKQVDDFLAWYDGQGEQDASTWFECGDSSLSSVNVDYKVKKHWDDTTLVVGLDVQ